MQLLPPETEQRRRWRRGEPWLTAAVPVGNTCCSCKLTRVAYSCGAQVHTHTHTHTAVYTHTHTHRTHRTHIVVCSLGSAECCDGTALHLYSPYSPLLSIGLPDCPHHPSRRHPKPKVNILSIGVTNTGCFARAGAEMGGFLPLEGSSELASAWKRMAPAYGPQPAKSSRGQLSQFACPECLPRWVVRTDRVGHLLQTVPSCLSDLPTCHLPSPSNMSCGPFNQACARCPILSTWVHRLWVLFRPYMPSNSEPQRNAGTPSPRAFFLLCRECRL